MSIRPTTSAAYKLMHDGVVFLAQVEANGMRVDVPHLKAAIDRTQEKIKGMQEKLKATDEWKLWRKRFGEKANLGSGPQLGSVLFGEKKYGWMGYKAKEMTATGKPSTDEGALEKLDLPFVRDYLLLKKNEKAQSTYLRGIYRELDMEGFIHPVFNLHTVLTYRSSSDNPNFQNMPVRVPWVAELVRTNFISRFGPDGVLTENDFKGIEVGVSACYHKDAAFIEYIEDPTKDMHGDMAAQLFIAPKEQITKEIRHVAKNKFVFPEFYGDFYPRCAESMWDALVRQKLCLKDGTPVIEWLAKKGIKSLGKCDPDERPVKGTFEYHVKEVEDDFWNNRFGEYGQWKKDWWNKYLKNGGFDTLTGFRIDGDMKRNQVINFPVQGSAFHCLLWSMIELMRELRRYKMKSVVAGQIHDSIIGDVHRKELSQYLEILHDIVGNRLRKHWPWIIVPMVIENEITPVNESWYYKREVEFSKGIYTFKNGDVKASFDNADEFLKNLKAKKAA